MQSFRNCFLFVKPNCDCPLCIWQPSSGICLRMQNKSTSLMRLPAEQVMCHCYNWHGISMFSGYLRLIIYLPGIHRFHIFHNSLLLMMTSTVQANKTTTVFKVGFRVLDLIWLIIPNLPFIQKTQQHLWHHNKGQTVSWVVDACYLLGIMTNTYWYISTYILIFA